MNLYQDVNMTVVPPPCYSAAQYSQGPMYPTAGSGYQPPAGFLFTSHHDHFRYLLPSKPVPREQLPELVTPPVSREWLPELASHSVSREWLPELASHPVSRDCLPLANKAVGLTGFPVPNEGLAAVNTAAPPPKRGRKRLTEEEKASRKQKQLWEKQQKLWEKQQREEQRKQETQKRRKLAPQSASKIVLPAAPVARGQWVQPASATGQYHRSNSVSSAYSSATPTPSPPQQPTMASYELHAPGPWPAADPTAVWMKGVDLPKHPSTSADVNGPKKQKRSKCNCLNCFNKNGECEKPVHPCPIDNCPKMYGKTSHLKAHLRWHEGKRPYKCEHLNCNSRFTRSDELKRHLRIHETGVRRFLCEICNSGFNRSDHYKKHKRTHMPKTGGSKTKKKKKKSVMKVKPSDNEANGEEKSVNTGSPSAVDPHKTSSPSATVNEERLTPGQEEDVGQNQQVQQQQHGFTVPTSDPPSAYPANNYYNSYTQESADGQIGYATANSDPQGYNGYTYPNGELPAYYTGSQEMPIAGSAVAAPTAAYHVGAEYRTGGPELAIAPAPTAAYHMGAEYRTGGQETTMTGSGAAAPSAAYHMGAEYKTGGQETTMTGSGAAAPTAAYHVVAEYKTGGQELTIAPAPTAAYHVVAEYKTGSQELAISPAPTAAYHMDADYKTGGQELAAAGSGAAAPTAAYHVVAEYKTGGQELTIAPAPTAAFHMGTEYLMFNTD